MHCPVFLSPSFKLPIVRIQSPKAWSLSEENIYYLYITRRGINVRLNAICSQQRAERGKGGGTEGGNACIYSYDRTSGGPTSDSESRRKNGANENESEDAREKIALHMYLCFAPRAQGGNRRARRVKRYRTIMTEGWRPL